MKPPHCCFKFLHLGLTFWRDLNGVGEALQVAAPQANGDWEVDSLAVRLRVLLIDRVGDED